MSVRYLFLLLLCSLCLCSCVSQHTSVLSQVPLDRSLKVALDGYYVYPNSEKQELPRRGTVYVAPMDVSSVQGEDEACLAAMQEYMSRSLSEEVAAALHDVSPQGEWTLTDKPEQATILYQTALVRFRPQRPLLRGLAVLAGPFVEIPFVSSAVKSYAKGDICIEGAIRLRETNALLFAFKDSNRESTALYESAAYRPEGNVEINLRVWAKKMARFIYADAIMIRSGCSFEEIVAQRSISDTVKAYRE